MSATKSPAEAEQIRKARAALAAAADREQTASDVLKEVTREWQDARKAHRQARAAYDAAMSAAEFARTHPALFGEDATERERG